MLCYYYHGYSFIILHLGTIFRQKGLLFIPVCFFKNNRTIPIDRIQNVDIVQNALQRIFRIASVKIETAGGKTTEGKLEYVGIQQAHAIRLEIEGLQTAANQQTHNTKFINHDETTPFFTLTVNELFRGSITRLSPVVLFVAGIVVPVLRNSEVFRLSPGIL